MAVPSAKNSGFDNTWKLTLFCLFENKISAIDLAALTGTVDFSTTIFDLSAIFEILLAADSI